MSTTKPSRLAIAVALLSIVSVAVFFGVRALRSTDAAKRAGNSGPADAAPPPTAPARAARAGPKFSVAPAHNDGHQPGGMDAPTSRSATVQPPRPIDRDHALDLLADYVARQTANNDAESAWRKRFDATPIDAALTTTLSERIGDVESQLPADVRDHFTVGSVTCRAGECEVFAAVNGVIEVPLGNNAVGARAPLEINDFVERITAQPWMSQSGLEFLASESHSIPNDDYLVYHLAFRAAHKS